MSLPHALHAVLVGHGAVLWTGSLLAAVCMLANVYTLLGVAAAREFFCRREEDESLFEPPVSILKPLRGLDPDAYRNLSSFFRQDYPEYEIVFAFESESDPAVPLVRRIAGEFPNVPARLVFRPAPATGSPKVASVAHAASASRHPFLLASDADIRVSPGHLRAMVRPLHDPQVGVVTCLYRSSGEGAVGRLDALGLSVEFQRDVLVARKVEGISFAMGSGILIRREVLEAIGGFDALSDSLTDDYLLGNLPRRMGYRIEFARDVVDHALSTRTWSELVRHQLRWNRGIRKSRPGGYAGLFLTHAPSLAFLFLIAESFSTFAWGLFAATLALSIASAWMVAGRLLDDEGVRRSLWLVPIRDALSFVLWIAGMFGNTVEWRGRRFRIGAYGLLTPASGEVTALDPRAAPRPAGRAPVS